MLEVSEEQLRDAKTITAEMVEDREKRIKAEMNKLKRLLKNVPKETLSASASLIKNAAFMSVTLDDLQDTINREGAVSFYKHGENQFGTKRSPEVEIYNTMVKNHMSVMYQLVGLLPKGHKDENADELMLFVKAGAKGR